MSTNDTVRSITESYAEMLSDLVKNITRTYKFKNFDMVYIDLPLEAMLAKWTALSGKPWQLIESVDGFHTNQIAHALYADALWEFLENNYPDWLGPVNPYNDDVTKIFGNQGGY
jgi:acyloxyacyl hydrolase